MKYLPEIIGGLICVVLFVLLVGLLLGIAYGIATSDLPDWFKFFLLS